MIRDFIEAVLGEAEGRTSLWWREKPGRKSPVDRQEWFSYPDELDKMVRFAESKASKDVYLPVAVFNADQRIPENTTLVHSLWNDTDTFNPDDYRVPPSIIVRTSEGRTHCWWTLDKPYEAKAAETVVKKVTYCHKGAGADVSSWGRNKLLRVPGTVNTSYGEPQPVTVEYTGNVYTLQEIAEVYDDVPLPVTPSRATTEPMPTEDAPTDLPDFFDTQSKLPDDFPLELLTAEPSADNRSELRWRLLAELIEAGLTNEETFVIAKQSPTARKWFEDRRGLDGLWSEILKERQRYEWGEIPDAVPATPEPRKSKKVRLLDDEERKRAKEHYKKSFICEYEEWVASHLKTFNPPYHRAAAWMVLSQLVGEAARINVRGKDIPLGLYFFVLGKTSTGKSESKDYLQIAIHRGYSGDQKNPDIGDDVSTMALLDILRDRPKGVTMMSSDEVDGALATMKDRGSWRSADLATYTYLYDGKVQPVARKGSTDNAGQWTKTQFSWFGMGTPAKVIDVLDRSMFESGFLARFQWWLGNDTEIDEDEMGTSVGGEASYREQNVAVDAWRERFSDIKQEWVIAGMGAYDGDLPIIEPDSKETAEFLKKKTAHIEFTLWNGDKNQDILKPSLRRTNITVVKMAALLAISDHRMSYSKDDILLALLHCEEVLENLYYVAGLVSSSDHAKQLDAIYDFVLGHGQDVKSSVIFRAMSERFGLTVTDVERYRDELRAQNRLSFVATGQKHEWKANAIERTE